ncbi:DMT family transporter [Oryzomicrobium terrae]|nr:DMT family transporter [Oryzomicrobium terrae]
MQSLWMLAASLLFACMGVCVKLASSAHSAAEIVFWRSLLSFLFIYAYARSRGLSLTTPHWRFQLQRAVSGLLSLMLYFYGIVMLPLATAVTLNYTSPLFLALFLVVLAGHRPPLMLWLSLGLGFVGVILLLHPVFSGDQWLAGALALGSGVLAGLAYYNVKELGALGESEWRTVLYFSGLSTVGAGLWLLVSGEGLGAFTLRGGVPTLQLLGVGGFATLAQLAMTRAYKRGRTFLSASLAYSTVVFASLFGAVLWDETIAAEGWLAILLIAASGLLASRYSRAPTRPAATP